MDLCTVALSREVVNALTVVFSFILEKKNNYEKSYNDNIILNYFLISI